MTNHGVIVVNQSLATDVPSKNRSGIYSGSDLDNGQVVRLASQSSGSQAEVWIATTPSTGSLADLWMVYTPEVPITVDGDLQFRGLTKDPRRFYNIAGLVFDAFKLEKDDIITCGSGVISGSPSTGNYIVAATGSVQLAFAAAPVANTLCLYNLGETYISIGSGNIDNQRLLAYKCVVLNNNPSF